MQGSNKSCVFVQKGLVSTRGHVFLVEKCRCQQRDKHACNVLWTLGIMHVLFALPSEEERQVHTYATYTYIHCMRAHTHTHTYAHTHIHTYISERWWLGSHKLCLYFNSILSNLLFGLLLLFASSILQKNRRPKNHNQTGISSFHGIPPRCSLSLSLSLSLCA